MYTCLKNDYPSFVPPPNKGGLLTPWADRGVLMLNACLTVRAHEAGSHANRGWERFTQKVLDLVAAKRTRGVVFMAWGTPAGKRVAKIDAKRNLVLKSVHPSPLSASRGFFTCRHFRLANEWLVGRYGPDGEIDWALTEGSTTKEVAKEEADKNKGEAAAAAQDADEDDFDDVDEDVLEELVMETQKAEVIATAQKVQVKVTTEKKTVKSVNDDENVDPEETKA